MSDVHNELRDSARQVVNGLGASAGEDKTWSQVVELGWLLVAVPEDLGGMGLGLPGACVIYSELGRGVATSPFLPAMLAINAVAATENADRDAWLERLTGGELVTTPLGLSSVTAKLSSAGGATLNGVASALQSADKASHVLICTAECVALAPLKQAGVEISLRPTWDETRRLFDVRFKNAEIEPKLVLASGAAAQAVGEGVSTHRDLALAADAVGGAEALLDMTVDYLKTRRQYGRPLAMFQALKHRCADLKAQTSAAAALLLDSLDRIGSADADVALMAKTAKHLACAVYARVGEEAVQLHGGIAMTSEHVCHRFVKRALLNEHLGERLDAYELDIAAGILDANR